MAIASSGQILSGVTIGSGGLLSVLGGGVAVGAVILSAGSEFVSAGGADSAATLVSGGMQFVGGGATATFTRIEGFFSSEVVLSGGTARATQNLGGQLIVSAGGIEQGASLSGATEIVFGSASGTVVSNSDQILSGGVAFGATVLGSLGLQLVSAGIAYDATIGSGAIQTIYFGALASLTSVSGGREVVAAGGGAVSTTLVAGGSAVVSSGGGATATVASGGTLSVLSGGHAYATVLSGGGVLRVLGGVASGTMIGSGGLEQVAPSGGGGDSGAAIAAGGLQTVGSGGIAFGAVVRSGGEQRLVSEDPFGGGATSGTVVQGGGAERVLANGTAFATTLFSGGAEIVSSGGIASGTVVHSGGIALVLSGGGTFGATVEAGGALIVLPGGTTESGVFQSGVATQGPAVVLDAPGAVSAWASVASGIAVGSGAALYVLSGGTADAASVGSSGTLTLEDGAVASGGIVFAGPAATLVVGGTAMPAALLSGFASGDSIDLRDVAPGSAATATLDSGSDVLTVSAGGGGYALALAGNLGGARFQVIGDGASGSLVTEVACYAAGTRIATDRGDMAVEALAPGDRIHTQHGRLAPVRWVGRRLVECRRHRWPARVMPIRVAADAFAPGRPRRDLFLSPDHAVFTGGVLIPVRYLVNGTTVAPVAVARVTYVHVELDRHEVILAEGLPCESFLDTGNRAAFANGGGPTELHPDFARRIWQAEGCAELVLAGPRLAEARRRLLARAALLGHRMTGDPALAVVTPRGRLPGTVRAACWQVPVPRDTASLVLRSRVWTPEHTDPAGDDPRRLGVALRRLALDGREVALDSPALAEGWHAAERGLRWTDGAGAIPVAGVREIAFELAMTGRYWRPALAGAAPPTPDRAASRSSARR